MDRRAPKLRIGDPDEFATTIGAVSASDVGVQAIGRSFDVSLELARLPRIGAFAVRTAPLRVTLDPPHAFCGLTFPLDGAFSAEVEGRRESFSHGELHVLRPDRSFDLQVAKATEMLIVNIDLLMLDDHARKLGVETSQLSERLAFSAPDVAALRRSAVFLWREARRGRLLDSAIATAELEGALVDRFLAGQGPNHGRRSKSSGTRLRVAEEYLAAHVGNPICAADLVEAVGVSQRSLFRAFREHRGQGPMAFLRDRRLEAARHRLLVAEAEETTVTEIALRYGFTHLSRFASEYHKAFGELPSETLRA